MWHDVARLCAGLGLPFRKPEPFPQPSLLAADNTPLGRAVVHSEFQNVKDLFDRVSGGTGPGAYPTDDRDPGNSGLKNRGGD